MEYINHYPVLFVLSGKAESGKNKVADIISNYYKEKKCIQISFAYYLKDYIKRMNYSISEENKPRDLLQSLGIDLIKNKINSRLLIDRVVDDIKVFSYFYDVIIVTDARLIDEIETLKKLFNGIIIRINSTKDNHLTLTQKNHITETALDNYTKYDYVVSNDDTLEKQIYDILEVIK